MGNIPNNFFPSVNDFDDTDTNDDGNVTEAEWQRFIDSFVKNKPANGLMVYNLKEREEGAPRQLWHSRRGISDVPSPILYKDLLFTVKDGGTVTCFDVQTGTVRFEERVGALGPYFASPVLIAYPGGADLVLCSHRGVVSVVPAFGEFRIKHQIDVNEEIRATPAIDEVSGRIYIRTVSELRAFSL